MNPTQFNDLVEFVESAISTRNRAENKEFYNNEDGVYDYENVRNFSLEEVIFSDKMTTLPSPCPHCGCGENNFVMFGLQKSDSWIVITNWCGCLTYGPSWTFREFREKSYATDYFERVLVDIDDN
jgi:hypothetical protein